MARRASGIVVISWRDIPAQVNAGAGNDKHQVVLPRRFQRAIDDAAMVADKKTASEYVGEWRRTSISVGPGATDLHGAADEHARQLDADYPRERLQRLVANGGWDPAASEPPT